MIAKLGVSQKGKKINACEESVHDNACAPENRENYIKSGLIFLLFHKYFKGYSLEYNTYNEELHNLYSSPRILRMMKSRRMRWEGHVARME
jgi:hypothetical protein